jgi:hypothetical protein
VGKQDGRLLEMLTPTLYLYLDYLTIHQDTMNDEQPQVGPSSHPALKRKPKSPHPQNDRAKRQKLPPPLPAKPISSHPATRNGHTHSLPVKVLQGQGTKRTDGIRQGYGRDVIFVTRKISLGALMGRCRSLVVDEG